VSNEWNRGSVRLITLLSAAMALGMLACTSEETMTEPSASASPARAVVKTYTAVDLGTLPGCCDGDETNVATSIDPAGQVVGSTGTVGASVHPFLWEKGIMTDLAPTGSFTTAAAINPAGQVVGYGGNNAVLWEKGVITNLGSLGGGSAFALAINPAGHVVGSSQTAQGAENHAFLWDKGVMTDLGTLGGGGSSATAINAAGQVVGASQTTAGETHAFLWENGVMTDLGTLGGHYSSAYGINPAGEVAGVSQVVGGGDNHPTLWTRK
jgi:probable HAF family extracellular repeat protein